MLVGDSVEEPLDVLFCTDDTWQTENLDGGVVGVNTHVHVALLTDRHDGFQEIFHVGTELCFVDTFVEVEELTEFLDRSLVVLREITRYETLCLDDDILHQLMFLLRCHRLGKLVTLCQHVTFYLLSLLVSHFEGSPFLSGTLTLEDIDVEISELRIVEIKVCRTVRVDVQ